MSISRLTRHWSRSPPQRFPTQPPRVRRPSHSAENWAATGTASTATPRWSPNARPSATSRSPSPATSSITRPQVRWSATTCAPWSTTGEPPTPTWSPTAIGEENYQIFQHGNLLSAVFHEDYHADGPKPNNAYRTFTFDMASGRRLQLSDLTKSDPLAAIPPLAQPFIETALNQAPPPHDPGSLPVRRRSLDSRQGLFRCVQGLGTDSRRINPLHARLPGGSRRADQLHTRSHAVVHGRRHRPSSYPALSPGFRAAHLVRRPPKTLTARVRCWRCRPSTAATGCSSRPALRCPTASARRC